MKHIRLYAHRSVIMLAFFVAAAGLSACGGGSTVATTTTATTTNASLAGSVIDGKVSGATLTLYSDQAMTTQVGSGTTDTTGAFNITLTVTTAPDPIYIKAVGGTDLDTGMPAPTMRFVGNTTGANALTSFNVTPLTDDVMDRIDDGDTLSAAQTNAKTAFGLTSNTGTNGLYEDHSLAANAGLKTAAFNKLTAGTTGGTIGAGTYKMFALTMGEADIGIRSIANIAGLTASSAFVTADIIVAANGDVSGTAGPQFITGKIVGSSMVFDIVDSTTAPTQITRVVGNIGLQGSVAGNFTDVSGLTTTPVLQKGMFVGSLIPASGVNATGLASFVSSFYSPGATSGLMNIVARDVFIGPSAATIPRVFWGQGAVTAVDAAAGSVTMSNLTLRGDGGGAPASGSKATAANTFTFGNGVYVKSGSIPTNLLVFKYTIPGGGTDQLYIVTSVGLRRGVYFIVPAATGKISAVGEAYMSKVDSVAPSGFTAGATHDITTANTHPGMPGLTRTQMLAQGLTPSIAVPGGMLIPSTLTSGTLGNGFLDTTTTGVPELMVFQGSMFVMKDDANDLFDGNFSAAGPDGKSDHLRVIEFFESGAMQGEEIQGGTIPGGGSLLLRNFPDNFIGFVHDRASTVTPSFSGTLNFLARTQYASNYASFATAYTSGTLTITAPTTTAGSATLVATDAGATTSSTSTLTIDVPASGAPGVYHIHGALTAGGYIDVVWPIGGTKALYAISASATGTVSEVGEAFITQ